MNVEHGFCKTSFNIHRWTSGCKRQNNKHFAQISRLSRFFVIKMTIFSCFSLMKIKPTWPANIVQSVLVASDRRRRRLLPLRRKSCWTHLYKNEWMNIWHNLEHGYYISSTYLPLLLPLLDLHFPRFLYVCRPNKVVHINVRKEPMCGRASAEAAAAACTKARNARRMQFYIVTNNHAHESHRVLKERKSKLKTLPLMISEGQQSLRWWCNG